jgi:hypothetical protein
MPPRYKKSAYDNRPEFLAWPRRLHAALAPWLVAIRLRRWPRHVGKRDLSLWGVVAECSELAPWTTLTLLPETVRRLYGRPEVGRVLLLRALQDPSGKLFSIEAKADGSLAITHRPASRAVRS